MDQCFQSQNVQEMQGKSIETTDAEILAAVRKVLTAEVVTHPDVQPPVRTSFWRAAPAEQMPARNVSPDTLVSRVLNRLRG